MYKPDSHFTLPHNKFFDGHIITTALTLSASKKLQSNFNRKKTLQNIKSGRYDVYYISVPRL